MIELHCTFRLCALGFAVGLVFQTGNASHSAITLTQVETNLKLSRSL
jgi:hypothetical protein